MNRLAEDAQTTCVEGRFEHQRQQRYVYSPLQINYTSLGPMSRLKVFRRCDLELRARPNQSQHPA